MIIKASQRGAPMALANHLLNEHDNDHIEVHEIKGFAIDNLHSAFKEIQGLARGTQCRQFLFSVSLNPPQNETAPIASFEDAINRIEKKINLVDQPRAIVFHEKEGRRHAHCVWSRIDAREMKAINLPYFKKNLNEISKELFLEHEWTLPKGYIDKRYSNPTNFTLAEWQQAKRADHDPKILKALFKQCWERSDSRQSFETALEEYGFMLARGDRRGYVAVDYKQEVYSLSRWTKIKTKELKERLGDPKELRSIEEANLKCSRKMDPVFKTYISELIEEKKKKLEPYKQAALTMRDQHRSARIRLKNKQQKRWYEEEQKRHDKVPKGLKGLLFRVIGRYGEIQRENRRQVENCKVRDLGEKEKLVHSQLDEKQELLSKMRVIYKEYLHVQREILRDKEKVARPIKLENAVAPFINSS